MLVDAHCHLATKVNGDLTTVDHKDDIVRCLMSTNNFDWTSVKNSKDPNVYIAFGIHPWYSHLFMLEEENKQNHYNNVLSFPASMSESDISNFIDLLPLPTLLSQYISTVDFSRVKCIGEIGLDKLFRLPSNGFYQSSTAESSLTQIRVTISHQQHVFQKMLDLACMYELPVSVHSVKCHHKVYEMTKNTLLNSSSNICLHSYTGSMDFFLNQWVKTFGSKAFISLSKWINFNGINDTKNDYSVLPISSVLTETDYTEDTASQKQYHDDLVYSLNCLKVLFPECNNMETIVYNNFIKFLNQE